MIRRLGGALLVTVLAAWLAVVEGVEDAAALDALSAWNCDLAQGYHIARPMPAEQLLSWLRARPLAAAVS